MMTLDYGRGREGKNAKILITKYVNDPRCLNYAYFVVRNTAASHRSRAALEGFG